MDYMKQLIMILKEINESLKAIAKAMDAPASSAGPSVQ